MEVLKIATKTLQLAIQTAIAGVKSVVDAIKITTDATNTKVDTIDTRTTTMNTNINTINTNVGSLINGRVVKSVQRGRFQTTQLSQQQAHTVPLSTINAAKSMYEVIMTDNASIEIGLTNNALTIKNVSAATTISAVANWQVIEFY